ncbi:MAG TPA: hypothetical protein PLE25_00615 [Spirochaetales bacterium]|nr:hypothetical protein [Spirochaetales bacterium]
MIAPPSRRRTPQESLGAAPRARSRIRLSPGGTIFDEYDGFIRSLGFLNGREAAKLIVAGDEVLDNLMTHGEISAAGVCVLVTRRERSGLTLGFFVDSHREFAEFTRHADERDGARPRFDQRERRWHGLGLTMCRNIASSVSYRSGELVDRVFLSFDVEPRPARSAP